MGRNDQSASNIWKRLCVLTSNANIENNLKSNSAADKPSFRMMPIEGTEPTCLHRVCIELRHRGHALWWYKRGILLSRMASLPIDCRFRVWFLSHYVKAGFDTSCVASFTCPTDSGPFQRLIAWNASPPFRRLSWSIWLRRTAFYYLNDKERKI